jgi:phage shock protein PspC (stress-responsive transcriptional regulator)/sulfur carrier protein ThiS
MNQTVTANIGGIVFHIDIDAYEQLQAYLKAIASYFNHSEGKEEILTDIELRIAELLKEKSAHEHQVITSVDVDVVIKTMGEPAQFDERDNNDTEDRTTNNASSRSKRRKVFRDPDDRYIGGVCSGIANYFELQSIWVRLLFLFAFFGFGTGLILYLILWALIPEAKTAAEKLKMKGEPINAGNIGKIIDEELNKMKTSVRDFTKKRSDINSDAFFQKLMFWLERFFHFIGNLLGTLIKLVAQIARTVFKVIGTVLGGVFLVLGLLLFLTLVTSLFNSTSLLAVTSGGFHYYAPKELLAYLTLDPNHWLFVIVGGALLVGLPILLIIYVGLKLLFPDQLKIKHKAVAPSLFALWILGLVVVVVLGFQVAMEFKDHARVDEKIALPIPENKVLTVKLNSQLFEDELDNNFDAKYSFEMWENGERIHLFRFHHLLFQPDHRGDHLIGLPRLRIKRSKSDQMELQLIKEAQGATHEAAEKRARSISYSYALHNDTLTLDPLFRLLENEQLFRGQDLDIVLHLPANTIVKLSEETNRLRPSIYFNYGLSNGDFWKHVPSRLGGHNWLVTNENFKCLSCPDMELDDLDSNQIKIVTQFESMH